jgi:hypothetical protein
MDHPIHHRSPWSTQEGGRRSPLPVQDRTYGKLALGHETQRALDSSTDYASNQQQPMLSQEE